MKRKVNFYTDEFKRQVVHEYLSTNCSYSELRRKYNIQGKSCISDWILRFVEKPKSPQEITMSEKSAEKSVREVELEARLTKLEKELAYERFRVTALDTMIDIAENELKISIRKKSGTKQ
ncbi:MAG: transposase [Bacteroidota bacterium]|nr:transposase [Bacteroidota bacterium]MDP4227471.1 transposase [Bacteroidota bacterium]